MAPGCRWRKIFARWRAVDASCALGMSLLSIVAIAFPARVPHWPLVIASNIMGIFLVALCRRLQLGMRGQFWRFVFGAWPLALFCALWGEIALFQHVFYAGWFDESLISLERGIFGVNLSFWLERCVTVWLTEWMMFAYFAYLPLLVIVAIVLFARAGEQAMDAFLFALSLGSGVCFVGFILFPVAGPRYWLAGQYSAELSGYVFRFLTRLMEDYGHFPGGSFPSPHSTFGTIMLLLACKYHRPTFWLILPVILSFYAATVYGRYHYLADTLSGILLGAVVVWLAPRVNALWERMRRSI